GRIGREVRRADILAALAEGHERRAEPIERFPERHDGAEHARGRFAFDPGGLDEGTTDQGGIRADARLVRSQAESDESDEAEGLRDRDPADVSMAPRRLLGRSSIDRTGPFAMRERPSDRGPARANVDRDPGLFLHELTDNLALRSLRRNLPAREGPQASEQFARLASDQQDPALRLDQRKGDLDRSDGGPPAGKWDFPFLPRAPREAESFHRASFAGGRNRRADRRAEFHHRLVERTGSVDRDEVRGEFRDAPSGRRSGDVRANPEKAADHPRHIPID